MKKKIIIYENLGQINAYYFKLEKYLIIKINNNLRGKGRIQILKCVFHAFRNKNTMFHIIA